MKLIVILAAVLAIAGAVWFFLLRDQGGEAAEAAAELEPAQPRQSLFAAPAYVNLGSVVAPIFRDGGVEGSLIAVIVLELTSGGYDDDVREQMAAIKDALLLVLYGASERLATYGVEPDIIDLKVRFRAASENVLGEGVVRDLLIQDFVIDDR